MIAMEGEREGEGNERREIPRELHTVNLLKKGGC